jgi:dehydrogenase/reductase SDR family member 7B
MEVSLLSLLLGLFFSLLLRDQSASSFLPTHQRQQQRHSGSPFATIATTTTRTTTTSQNRHAAAPAPAPAARTNMVKSATQEAFRGTNVLLTGASSGLGKSFALTLAKECHVKTLILSARPSDALELVAAQCREYQQQQHHPPCTVHVVPCDLADPQSVANLGRKAIELCGGGDDGNNTSSTSTGTINVLINNGGVSSRSTFVETDITVDAQIMQINFLAGAALAKAVVPTMMITTGGGKGGGDGHNNNNNKIKNRIIWISSVQGLVGIPNRSSYAASKFAVQGYCESIRAELYHHNIRVHTVSPGYINTNLSQSAVTGDGRPYGQMDATTAAGADPHVLAATILDRCVVDDDVDFTIAAPVSAVAAIWLRLLCPGVLRQLLVRRFAKSDPKDKQD